MSSNTSPPAIRIRALRLVGLVGGGYEVQFWRQEDPRPLAVIAGHIRTGKTSTLELILYCLGSRRHPTHPEFQEHVSSALLEIDLDGETCVLQRRLFTSQRIVILHRTSLDLMREPHDTLDFPLDPPGSESSLSSFLLGSVGLAGISLKEAPTKAASGTDPFSFRNLLWLCYLPSRRLDAHILMHEDQRMEMLYLVQTLEVLFEVADQDVNTAGAKLADLERSRDALALELRSILAFLEEQADSDPASLRSSISTLKAARRELESQMRLLDRDMRAATSYAESLRAEYAAAALTAREADEHLRSQEILLRRLGPLRAQYAEDLKKVTFVEEAERLIGPLPVVMCPVCLSNLTPQPSVADGQCTLCHTRVSSLGEREIDIDRELRATKIRLSELNAYMQEIEASISELAAYRTTASLNERRAQQTLDSAVSARLAPFVAQRDALTRSESRISSDVGSLERQLELHARLDRRRSAISRLEEEASRIRERIARLQAERPSRDDVVAELSERFDGLLRAFHFPGLQNAHLDKKFAPVVNGRSYHEETSNGAQTLISLAWQLAVFESAVERGAPHPGFLLIDSPEKNLGSRDATADAAFQDPRLALEVWSHLSEWTNAHSSMAQIIVAETSPHASREDVVVTFSGPGGPPPVGLIDPALAPVELSESEAAYRAGRGYAERGDTDRAEAAWTRADEGGNAEAAVGVGRLFLARGDLAEAERAFSRADSRGSATGARNLGALLARRGESEAAEAAWRRAMDRGDTGAAGDLKAHLERREGPGSGP